MANTTTVTATEFSRNFAQIKDDVREHGVITVMSHHRVVGGFLSPKELESYHRMKRREREVLLTGELPDDFLADLQTAAETYDG